MSLFHDIIVETIDDAQSFNQPPKCNVVDSITKAEHDMVHPFAGIEDSIKKLYKKKRTGSQLLNDKAKADELKRQAKQRRSQNGQ